MWRRGWLWLGLAACTPGGGGPGVDDTGSGDACSPDAEPTLEFARSLVDGQMVDGDPISVGIPPQGGAPYAPFQVRTQMWLSDPSARVPATATATEISTGEVIGSVEQTQAFFCSNTGVHDGWLYGGEIHVRFWGITLDNLEGREVEVVIEITPEGEDPITAQASGTLTVAL